MVPGQIRINLDAPCINATRHRPNMFKAVTRKERGCVKAPDAVMANKDEFLVFRRPGDHFLHEFLSEKGGTFDVDSIPFFPAPNINQWKLFTGFQPLRNLCGRDLHLLICLVPGQDCTDDLFDREIFVSRTNRGQSLTRAKAAMRTAPNVIGAKKSSLSARVLLKKLRHRHVGVDCSRHTHDTSVTSFRRKIKEAGYRGVSGSKTNSNFEMDALNRGRNTLVAGAALVLFAFVYYGLMFRYGFNLADEGNIALISQRLMHGERPFLSNLFAITFFLTSQRKTLLSVGAGLWLGTTYLIRIDIGIFFTAIWFGVILLHAVLLHRRLRLNLIVAANLLLGAAVMHLPFIYDAQHRHFLQPFADWSQRRTTKGLLHF